MTSQELKRYLFEDLHKDVHKLKNLRHGYYVCHLAAPVNFNMCNNSVQSDKNRYHTALFFRIK